MFKKLQISILMLIASMLIPNAAFAGETPDGTVTIESY